MTTDTVDRVEFNGLPPNFTEWMAWFRQHGIDPDEVHAHGWCERDTERRQVRYRSLVILGRTRRPGDCYDAIEYAMDGDELRLVDKTVQLEAAPMPFPHGGRLR